MSKSKMTNTLKTMMTLMKGLEKGYKFILRDTEELTDINDIIHADNNYEPIYIYKPNGELAYIQNEKKEDKKT